LLVVLSTCSARYRPIASYRPQHQDATISDEQGRRAAETRRHVG